MCAYVRYYDYYYTRSLGTYRYEYSFSAEENPTRNVYEYMNHTTSENRITYAQEPKVTHGDSARVYHFIRKQSGFVVHTPAGTGWKRPRAAPEQRKFNNKNKPNTAQKLYSGGVLGIMFVFATTTPRPQGLLPLCKHQYRQCLCPCTVFMCSLDGEKRGKNCREKQNKKQK